MTDDQKNELTSLTVDLLSAFVSKNAVRSDDLPSLISSTHAALAGLATSTEPQADAAPEFMPAVTARKSLGDREHILSMIDGKPYRSLKRHLGKHGLTPEEYRSRYNLPVSYPMVAPGYSDARREVAKRLGLGRKAVAKVTDAVAETVGGLVNAVLPAATDKAPAAKSKSPRKPKGSNAKAAAERHLSDKGE